MGRLGGVGAAGPARAVPRRDRAAARSSSSSWPGSPRTRRPTSISSSSCTSACSSASRGGTGSSTAASASSRRSGSGCSRSSASSAESTSAICPRAGGASPAARSRGSAGCPCGSWARSPALLLVGIYLGFALSLSGASDRLAGRHRRRCGWPPAPVRAAAPAARARAAARAVPRRGDPARAGRRRRPRRPERRHDPRRRAVQARRSDRRLRRPAAPRTAIGEALARCAGPGRRDRPHRQRADPHAALSLELGALQGARRVGGAGSSRPACPPSGCAPTAGATPSRSRRTTRPQGRAKNRRVEITLYVPGGRRAGSAAAARPRRPIEGR